MSKSTSLRVRSSSRLADGLKFWPTFVAAKTYVRCVVSGEIGAITSPSGIADDYNEEGHGAVSGASTTQVDFPNVPTGIGTGPFTMVVRCKPLSSTTFRGPIVLPNNTNICLFTPSGNDTEIGIDTTSDSTSRFIVGQSMIDVFSTVSASHPGSAVPQARVHFNGENIPPSVAKTFTYAGGTTGVRIMTANSSSFRQYLGVLAWAAVWNRLLSDAEHLSLHENPFQMFEAHRRAMWIPSASVAVSPLHYGAYWM